MAGGDAPDGALRRWLSSRNPWAGSAGDLGPTGAKDAGASRDGVYRERTNTDLNDNESQCQQRIRREVAIFLGATPGPFIYGLHAARATR